MTRRRRIALGAAIVLAVLFLIPATMTAIGLIRFVYVPSENMEPTFAPGDRLLAWMRPPPEWRRGDIILLRPPDGRGLWIKRIAGLPGDRIAMVDGVVILNGRPVPQPLVGTMWDPLESTCRHASLSIL